MSKTAIQNAGNIIARKSPNHLAGILIGLLLSVQFPSLLDLVRQYVGTLGLGAGGAGLLAVSIWITTSRDKKHASEVLDALLQEPPK